MSDNKEADDHDLAQAFRDLAEGERTALALENHLDNLEMKIDRLLASVEAQRGEHKEESSATDTRKAKDNRKVPTNE